MKILKYILLLALLVFIASSIFVATLKPDYKISRTQIVKLEQSTAFATVNDLKNWEQFFALKTTDSKTKFIFNKKSTGQGSFFSWKNQDSEGKITTFFVKANDSIHQKMKFNDEVSDIYWTFKNQNGKTKITWTNIGEMSFLNKTFTAISGGVDDVVGDLFEKSITKLENTNKTKISIYSIIPNGFLETSMENYLQKTINSTNANLDNNIQIMIKNIINHVVKNKIVVTGKPFVKYNYTDDLKQVTNFSICIPIKDSINRTIGKEYKFANMLSYKAIKTTLNGDLIYKNEAKNKAIELVKENNLIQNLDLPIIEVYKANITNTKDSNNWITEILIPVKKKNFVKKYTKPAIANINNTSTNNQTITTNPDVKTVVPEKIIIKKDFPQ